MESTLSTTSSLLSLTKTLNKSPKPLTSNLHRQLSRSILHQCLHKRFISCKTNCINNRNLHNSFDLVSSSASLLRNLCFVTPVSSRLACISSSTAPFASSGGGNDGFGGGSNGGGGGGDSGSSGGEIGSKSVAAESDEVSALSPDVIILDVGGMTCGGCAASVKRILENQPNVSSASVNLATETAIVWPVSEAKVMQNWQQQLGDTLAKHLTNCGFKSNPRESTRDSYYKVFEKKMDEKHKRLKESGCLGCVRDEWWTYFPNGGMAHSQLEADASGV